ncbi:MAG: SDR family oxidoreductase [Nitrosarchaeum sp.]|nr:MAG: SDR family oxidoreductase [Nitrosarchaeum sp.]
MDKQVALVTGASRGIGKVIAHLFAQEGMNVVICSRNENQIRKTAMEIQKDTGNLVVPVKTDVRNHIDVDKLVKITINKFGRIDILVNNAGVAIIKPLMKTTDHEYDTIIDTNLKGLFFCCRSVLPHMIKRKSGYIINISSGAGKTGFANLSVYCASKFGVIGITESLAGEVSDYGIKVFSVCPGTVATQMQKEFMSNEEFERRKNQMIQPEEVAQKVLQLVKGKFRTGTSVNIH